MKHTPGPWRELAPGVIAAETDPGWGAIAKVSQAEAEPEGRANARLIAAAPELLKALLRAEDALDIAAKIFRDFNTPGAATIDDVRQQARAAIEAAKS